MTTSFWRSWSSYHLLTRMWIAPSISTALASATGQLPLGIEVPPAAVRFNADALTGRSRESGTTAEAGEVDLGERLGALLDIGQGEEQGCAVPGPRRLIERGTQSIRPDQALLDHRSEYAAGRARSGEGRRRKHERVLRAV